jgi:UDP-N-acetylmuramoylalanine--D-glutamate ligase
MSTEFVVIVGLGATGFSVAKFLKKCHKQFALVDTRLEPPFLTEYGETFPESEIVLGRLDPGLLQRATQIVISPGVSLTEPIIAECIRRKIPVIGDIALFVEAANAPIIAITGTNAKSTVTTLAKAGGNLGVPALDLLTMPPPDAYVLELSSFQLETVPMLKARVATVLNISADHMDRYQHIDDYIAAKRHIYDGCESLVVNKDDRHTDYAQASTQTKTTFTLATPGENEFGILIQNNVAYLAFENVAWLRVDDLPIAGQHYQTNALAALAIGHAFGVDAKSMCQTLKKFQGLAHRCQLIRELADVKWVNDSKGTNVGATVAAIKGLGPVIDGKLILIAGGVSKGADFSELVPYVAEFVKTVILIGEAADNLAELFSGHVPILRVSSMAEAVNSAHKSATPGDTVLLSPACASFDMFKNFEHRGKVFSDIVQGLA